MVLLFGLVGGIITVTVRANQSSKKQDQIKSDFRTDSEPAGFRGITWMMNLSTLSVMQRLPSDSKTFKLYERIGEKKKIGEANIQHIHYWTLHDKFAKVEILFNGQENWDLLKKIVFERFGPGRKSTDKENYYDWCGKRVTMILYFDAKFHKGGMEILHNYIIEVMKRAAEDLIKAKKEIEQIKKTMKEQGLPTDELEDF